MTITARELARQKKLAARERELEFRKKARARLRELRGHLKHARGYRSKRLRQVVRLCRAARRANRDRIKAIRAEHRRQANLEALALREYAAKECAGRKDAARARAEDAIARAERVLAEEAAFQQQVRAVTEPAKRTRVEASRRAAELRRESDDEVANNIPRELAPVWSAVKARIHESPRRTRTEAFLEWAEENAGEVRRILDASYEADVARMVEEERQLGRELRRRRTRRAPAYAEPVPF